MAAEMGQPMSAGMIALGAFAAATGIVRVESLTEALAEVLPPHRRKLVDANRRSVERGAEHVGREGGGAWA
jgi:2-oxoglutarate ferredoxin oxidoreductase subunit gamma